MAYTTFIFGGPGRPTPTSLSSQPARKNPSSEDKVNTQFQKFQEEMNQTTYNALKQTIDISPKGMQQFKDKTRFAVYSTIDDLITIVSQAKKNKLDLNHDVVFEFINTRSQRSLTDREKVAISKFLNENANPTHDEFIHFLKQMKPTTYDFISLFIDNVNSSICYIFTSIMHAIFGGPENQPASETPRPASVAANKTVLPFIFQSELDALKEMVKRMETYGEEFITDPKFANTHDLSKHVYKLYETKLNEQKETCRASEFLPFFKEQLEQAKGFTIYRTELNVLEDIINLIKYDNDVEINDERFVKLHKELSGAMKKEYKTAKALTDRQNILQEKQIGLLRDMEAFFTGQLQTATDQRIIAQIVYTIITDNEYESVNNEEFKRAFDKLSDHTKEMYYHAIRENSYLLKDVKHFFESLLPE